MKAFLTFLAAACLAAAMPLRADDALRRKPAAPVSPAAEEAWGTDHAKAVARARAENKTLLMNFTGSDWCPLCFHLKREVFDTPEFTSYARKNLVLLEVDFPQGKELPAKLREQNDRLAEKYGVNQYPTVLVLDPKGKILGILGYGPSEPRAWIAELEALTSKR